MYFFGAVEIKTLKLSNSPDTIWLNYYMALLTMLRPLMGIAASDHRQ